MKIRSAFTLIELLVVIAIIAILAAILFPVFAQAKLAAKKSVDVSNTKQEGLAFQMYFADADDMTPIAYPNNSLASYTTPATRTATSAAGLLARQAFWTNSTNPYKKNYAIDAIPVGKMENWFGIATSVNPQNYMDGYTYNSYLNTYNSTGIQAPADVVLLWPGNGAQNVYGFGNCYPLPYFADIGFPSTAQTTPYQFKNTGPSCLQNLGIWSGGDSGDYIYTMYSLGFNMNYADGHSKFVPAASSRSPWSSVDAQGHFTAWNYDKIDGDTNGCYYVKAFAPVTSDGLN